MFPASRTTILNLARLMKGSSSHVWILTAWIPVCLLVIAARSVRATLSPDLPEVRPKDSCNRAKFIADITVPDGTTFSSGAIFTKTWRLKNIGECTWTAGYSLVFSSGEQMGAPQSVNLPYPVPPDKTLDISINLIAPSTAGVHRGYWMLKNERGLPFGIGVDANTPFWVDILVQTNRMGVVRDLALEACSAAWFHDGARLACPSDAALMHQGFVSTILQPVLETGQTSPEPALLTMPALRMNAIVQGVYPIMEMLAGDRFQAQVGCEFQSVGCLVTFQLEYRVAGGGQYVLWKSKESYDFNMNFVDIDLSPLAWKRNVQLILTVSASGSAAGDRALWNSPRIARPAAGVPPTETAGPEYPPVGPGTPYPACDAAAFIADVTIPDGTRVDAGQSFTKTWRVQNIGICSWTQAYNLTFSGGDSLNGQSSISMPYEVLPGGSVDLSVNLIAPSQIGSYSGQWLLRNAAGVTFGIGIVNAPLRTSIRVDSQTVPPPAAAGFDFTASACSAEWTNNVRALACPGEESGSGGYVLITSGLLLENGQLDTRSGLLIHPMDLNDGYVQGRYPAYTVQSGDRFQATVGCEYSVPDCLVVLRLDYQVADGTTQTFWAFVERYEGMVYDVDLDLTPLAGQNVKFILATQAGGAPNGDRAVWVAPRIVHTTTGPTQTGVPTTEDPDSITPTAIVATPLPPEGIRRVLIVSFDGLRSDLLDLVWMPNLRRLMNKGASTLNAQTISPSTTLPAHSSMLVGVCPAKHGVTWNEYHPENGFARGEDLFDLAHAHGFFTVMVVGKEKLAQVTEPGSLDIFKVIDDRDLVIAERVAAGFPVDFGLMFIHFPMLDEIGHKDGWLSEGQLKAAGLADQAMGKILAELDAKGYSDETLIIVTADHGGHNLRHGTDLPEDMTIPWIVSGPGVFATTISAPVYIMDTAATAAYALGLPIPVEWDGVPVGEAFGQPARVRQSAGCE